MLANIPVKVAYEHYHEKLHEGVITTERILKQLDLQPVRCFYDGRHVYRGKVYLAAVPFGNQFHQVIIDCRTDPMTVWDPLMGTGSQYYAWEPNKADEPLAIPLLHWMTEYEVVPHD